MVRTLLIMTFVWSWMLPLQTWAGAPQETAGPPPETLSPPLAELPIVGIPFEEAIAILERHKEELRDLPGVEEVGLNAEGIVVYTDNPAVLPTAVEGLPIKPRPPMGIRVVGKPLTEARAILKRHKKELKQLPGVEEVGLGPEGIEVYTENPAVLPKVVEGVPIKPRPPSRPAAQVPASEPQQQVSPRPKQECGPEAHWDATAGRCRRNAPLAVSPPPLLPPPPGVIILRLGGVREQADSCPEGFQEYVSLGGWRFCLDPAHPEPIPPLMAPPIAGIPYEECLMILERHQAELMRLPGVNSVGLGEVGIHVFTDNPAVVPREVEGLPIKTFPRLEPAKPANHTDIIRIRPLHGAVSFRDVKMPSIFGVLTHAALSLGKPWLVFPAHLLDDCEMNSVCRPGSTTTLNDCPHSEIRPSDQFGQHAGTQLILQPPAGSTERVGLVQRWDPLVPNGRSADVAAAFMDNDLVEGDMSLHADRRLEGWSGAFVGGTGTTLPVVGRTVTVVSKVDPPILTATVLVVNYDQPVASISCNGGFTTTFYGQMRLEVQQGLCFVQGDSGATVLNEAGEIVGMFNWVQVPSNPCIGGGTVAATIRSVLGFDSWYGTATSGFALKCN